MAKTIFWSCIYSHNKRQNLLLFIYRPDSSHCPDSGFLWLVVVKGMLRWFPGAIGPQNQQPLILLRCANETRLRIWSCSLTLTSANTMSFAMEHNPQLPPSNLITDLKSIKSMLHARVRLRNQEPCPSHTLTKPRAHLGSQP